MNFPAHHIFQCLRAYVCTLNLLFLRSDKLFHKNLLFIFAKAKELNCGLSLVIGDHVLPKSLPKT